MNLFAYGTLMEPSVMERVARELPNRQWGTLKGYERRAFKEKTYPGLVEKAGSSVRGIVYFDLSARAWERLDRFEGDRYTKKEVHVFLDDGPSAAAWTYVTAQEFIYELSDEGWDYEAFRLKRHGGIRGLARRLR
jgi:gamma-glutamylcyclotransferase (GGCT)/AIG2-like uncharacterized protein YtfP